MTHLLVTNDFPPKVGGIQAYLWELWSRLDPATYGVLTASSHPDAGRFDAEQAARGVRVERAPARMLLPVPGMVRRIEESASAIGATLVVLDPALPIGLVGPRLSLPYAVVLHGAEVAVPGRLPGTRRALGRVLGSAALAVCAGTYPEDEARRAAGSLMPRAVQVPPGVDVDRFVPLGLPERVAVRRSLGLPARDPVVMSLSRLVPRKGMDVLIEASAAVSGGFPELTVAIGGTGRDRRRLERLATAKRAPVRFLGHVVDEDLPGLYGCADVYVMACRNRWAGLEQEGFGIVFLEAAASGVAQIAGNSGGAPEAVQDHATGLVLDDPGPAELARALRRILGNRPLAARMGDYGRKRVEQSFNYNCLARRLAEALSGVGG